MSAGSRAGNGPRSMETIFSAEQTARQPNPRSLKMLLALKFFQRIRKEEKK